MRTFIGADFSRDIKESIAGVQHVVRENSERGRFKYVGNFHLTFKFLGEIEQSKAPDIGRVLRDIALKHRRIRLNIDKIGYFDGKGSIHALWLGFSGELDKLSALYSDIDEGMQRLGIKKEIKAYTPHITIAQDLVLKIPFEKLEEKVDFRSFRTVEIREISLIKSEELQGKRIYTPISAFQLK
jgi:2'-5' RNA ligase